MKQETFDTFQFQTHYYTLHFIYIGLTLQEEIREDFCIGVDPIQKNIYLSLQSISGNEVYMEEGEQKRVNLVF